MRSNDKKSIDKFLGLFGFKRPKKDDNSDKYANEKSDFTDNQNYGKAMKRRKTIDEGPILDENFEIVSFSNTKKKKKKKSGTVLKLFLSVFLIGVIAICITIGAFALYVFVFVDGTVDNDLYNLKLDYTSIVIAEDDKGKEVELARLHGPENRLWVDFEDMPEHIRFAFISAEDKRFNAHNGVDWKRTFSAFANYVLHFWDTNQGGSTITQQLVKNITKDDDLSSTRKIREIMRARYLEAKYHKDDILECYLNTIHLGSGVDGVEVAANYYFDKNVNDLTLTQAASLASVAKSPEGYSPYKYPEENKSRRNWVLSEMYNNGYISEEQLKEAKEADLGLRDKPSTILTSTKTVQKEYYSYYVDAVIEDVIKGLMETKNYSYQYAESQLFKGGYKIYTTIDLNVQKALESVFANDSHFMKVRTKSGGKPQAAMTIMDYEGHIVGIVGGRGEKKENRGLNRAIQSPRQTGSVIKPLAAYAPAIEYNVITYASKMLDGPISRLESGQTVGKWPMNYTGYYSGTVSVLRALQVSMNTIPVKLVQTLGTKTCFDFLTQRLGVSTYYESYKTKDGKTLSDVGESALALGGSVKGITSTELAAAYCVFGNLGTYWKPTTYKKVLDQQNKVVIEQQSKGERAVSSETSFVMNKMLQTVTTKGTGSAARIGNWPIISKTGTTSDNKDRWFVGGTPYYMATAWFGMDSSETMNGLYKNPCIVIWKAVMEKVHKNLKLKDFPDCDTAEYRLYCTDSGMAANSGCKNTAYGWFKSNYHPTCTRHSGSELTPKNKPVRVGEKTTAKAENTTAVNTTEENTATTNTLTTTTIITTKPIEQETTVAGITDHVSTAPTTRPTQQSSSTTSQTKTKPQSSTS